MHVLDKRSTKAFFLKSAYDLSSIGFLKRKFVREGIDFGVRTCVERAECEKPTRIETEEVEGFVVWLYTDKSNISAVLISDKEYPEKPAIMALKKILKEFYQFFTLNDAKSMTEEKNDSFPALDALLQKYQDPFEVDKLMKVESDLNEIQDILQKTMKDMLQRGEDLDQLMKQSEDISALAYQFHDKSKKANKTCCSIY